MINLPIYAINDYTMGPYNFYTVTPEGDTLYFTTKQKAKHFISIYNETKNKRDQYVKQDRRPTMGR